MDESLSVVYEMNEHVWDRLKTALADVHPEEIDWRPTPEANSINIIVRHLRIEAEWHVNSLGGGSPLPTIAAPVSQPAIDSVPLDFLKNLAALSEFQAQYLGTLRASTLEEVGRRTATAYGDALAPEGATYLISYHHAVHMAMHCGQIRTLRNLYRKAQGKPALFFPGNPTYPT